MAKNKLAYDAVVAVLSDLDGIFTLTGEERMTLKAFASGQHCFALLLTGSGGSLDSRCDT